MSKKEAGGVSKNAAVKDFERRIDVDGCSCVRCAACGSPNAAQDFSAGFDRMSVICPKEDGGCGIGYFVPVEVFRTPDPEVLSRVGAKSARSALCGTKKGYVNKGPSKSEGADEE